MKVVLEQGQPKGSTIGFTRPTVCHMTLVNISERHHITLQERALGICTVTH